jgi:hypothetical protein
MAKQLDGLAIGTTSFNEMMIKRELFALIIGLPLGVFIVLLRYHFYGDGEDNISIIQSNVYWLFTATYGASLALVLGNANQIMVAAAQARSMVTFRGESLAVRGPKLLPFDVDALLTIAMTDSIARNIRSMTVEFGYPMWIYVINDFLGFYYAASMGLTNWYPCVEQFFIILVAVTCRILLSRIPQTLFYAA